MCIVECLVENKVQRAEQKIYILRASSKSTSKIEVVSFPGPKGVPRLLTESLKVYEVVLDRSINFELRYSGARPLRDLKTIKGYLDNMLSSKLFSNYKNFRTAAMDLHLRHSLRKLELALHDFGVFEVCLLVLSHSFPKHHCNSRNAVESRLCR